MKTFLKHILFAVKKLSNSYFTPNQHILFKFNPTLVVIKKKMTLWLEPEVRIWAPPSYYFWAFILTTTSQLQHIWKCLLQHAANDKRKR